jgi:hypothetical protein
LAISFLRNFKQVFVRDMGLKSLTFLGEGFFGIRVLSKEVLPL